eukprot:UN20912
MNRMMVVETREPIVILKTNEKRTRQQSERFEGLNTVTKKNKQNSTVKHGYKGGFNDKYKTQLRKQFGDDGISLVKLHVERELLNGLEIESNLP